MSYTSLERLIERYKEAFLIRLTDDTGKLIDEATVNRAITSTDGVIDGYLRGIYTLPLSEVPTELEAAAVALVLAELYANKPERETPKDVQSRATQAMAWLRDIKKGLAELSVATLPLAPGTSLVAGGGNFVKTSKKPSDRIFTDAKLDSYTR